MYNRRRNIGRNIGRTLVFLQGNVSECKQDCSNDNVLLSLLTLELVGASSRARGGPPVGAGKRAMAGVSNNRTWSEPLGQFASHTAIP